MRSVHRSSVDVSHTHALCAPGLNVRASCAGIFPGGSSGQMWRNADPKGRISCAVATSYVALQPVANDAWIFPMLCDSGSNAGSRDCIRNVVEPDREA